MEMKFRKSVIADREEDLRYTVGDVVYVATNSSQPVTIYETTGGWDGIIQMLGTEEFPRTFDTFEAAAEWVTIEVGTE